MTEAGRSQEAEEASRLADRLEERLPQTQCGKCGYGGCRPYAEALAAGSATPDLCRPGGNITARALADDLSYPINKLRDMPDEEPQVALVDGGRCVGCYKCIEACPVDAVIGAHGLMHTVLRELCTGCGLCVDPCPVDCIALVPAAGARGDGQLVSGGIVGRPEAAAAARRLRERHGRKSGRPSLRAPGSVSPGDPKELARRAVNRARRRRDRPASRA